MVSATLHLGSMAWAIGGEYMFKRWMLTQECTMASRWHHDDIIHCNNNDVIMHSWVNMKPFLDTCVEPPVSSCKHVLQCVKCLLNIFTADCSHHTAHKVIETIVAACSYFYQLLTLHLSPICSQHYLFFFPEILVFCSLPRVHMCSRGKAMPSCLCVCRKIILKNTSSR